MEISQPACSNPSGGTPAIWKVTRHEACQLVSLAGKVAVTQRVDKPDYGVQARMRKSIFVAK